MLGTTISHYKILEKLGEGGVGVVYKAEDLKLRRQVALKFLLPAAVSRADARERFFREAQAAAKIEHQNICAIYEINELTQGGNEHVFVAMQFVPGQNLRSRIETGTFSLVEALDIGIQVGLGLERSHQAGVVHRDIKPANIILNNDGVAKIVDFGLASIRGQSQLTKDGHIVGTMAYMSPEQAQGKRIDHRTDIWSLAVVLYELIAHRRPFDEEYELALLYAILNEAPTPLEETRADVPASLGQAVAKALQKSPAKRHDTMTELLDELRRVAQDLGMARYHEPSVSQSQPAPAVAFAMPTRSGSFEGPAPSIAVLPFLDMSAEQDQEYFCEGTAEEIINALSQIRKLRVASRGSAFRFSPKSYDIEEVGKKLRVESVLEGSVRRAGSRLRISVQLTNCRDGYQLWASRFDREIEDIFEVQEEIAREVVAALRVKFDTEFGEALTRRQPDNVEAYTLYLKGRYMWNRRVPGAMRKAIELYQEALQHDPSFALAYAGLADAYIAPGYYGAAPQLAVMPKGKEAALKAIDLDGTLADGHTTLGMIYSVFENDWNEGEKHFRFAMQQSPGLSQAPMWLSLFNLTPRGRSTEAVSAARKAQFLDPLTPANNDAVGASLFYSGMNEKAITELERAAELDPSFPTTHYHLGRAYLEAGKLDRAVSSLGRACEIYPGHSLFDCHFALAQARAGNGDAARKLLHDFETSWSDRYVSAAARAVLFLALGDTEAALSHFEEAYEKERSIYLIWIAVDPLYASLHDHPRYQKLVDRLRLSN